MKVFYLNHADGPLACLMTSSAIEAANSAVQEIFTYIYSTIDEDSSTPCNKVMLKTVRGTYYIFTDKEKAEFACQSLQIVLAFTHNSSYS